MTLRIISGGQSGVDQAALFAAKRSGIATGGTAPNGFKTEYGPAPWLKDYGLVESNSASYPVRTRKNIEDADATLVFSVFDDNGHTSAGSQLTLDMLTRLKKEFRCVMMEYRSNDSGDSTVKISLGTHTPKDIAEWITESGIETLNIAGTRESKASGICQLVIRYLVTVFSNLKDM